MISLELVPENFNDLGVECIIVPISFLNVKNHIELIEESIKHFNDEIDWDEMFNINDAIERISNGMVMYILMSDKGVLGHTWFADKNNQRIIFNLFVRNKIETKSYSGKEFVSNIIKRFEYGKPIYCDVDDWNEKSLRLLKKLGFIVQNK